MSWIITYPPEYYLQLGGESVPTETRYIATLKASEGGYIKLAQPIDIGANDDFEITYVFATDAPAYSVLIGNDTTRLFRIEPNGELRAYCGVMNLTSTIIVNDGKLHTATVKRIGNVFSLKVDNENELSVATVSVFSELIFEEITKHGTSYSNVTPLELKSTTLNTLTHHYDFNVAKGTTVIPNLAQPLGSELVDGYVSGFVATATTSTNYYSPSTGDARTTKWLDVNNVSSLLVKRTNSTRNWVQFSFDNIATATAAFDATSQELINVPSGATHVRIYYGFKDDVNPTISIRAANGWAEYINVTDDNKEQFTWDAERNAWVGNDTGNVLEVAQ